MTFVSAFCFTGKPRYFHSYGGKDKRPSIFFDSDGDFKIESNITIAMCNNKTEITSKTTFYNERRAAHSFEVLKTVIFFAKLYFFKKGFFLIFKISKILKILCFFENV